MSRYVVTIASADSVRVLAVELTDEEAAGVRKVAAATKPRWRGPTLTVQPWGGASEDARRATTATG